MSNIEKPVDTCEGVLKYYRGKTHLCKGTEVLDVSGSLYLNNWMSYKKNSRAKESKNGWWYGTPCEGAGCCFSLTAIVLTVNS